MEWQEIQQDAKHLDTKEERLQGSTSSVDGSGVKDSSSSADRVASPKMSPRVTWDHQQVDPPSPSVELFNDSCK